MKLPAEFKIENGPPALQDSREQTPLDLSPWRVEIATLATGDYSVRGLEHVIAIERKSAEDMLGCIGRERGEWRGDVTPAAAIGSLLGWIAAGVPVVMAYDHARAGRFVSRMLFIAARRRYRELRTMLADTQEATTA